MLKEEERLLSEKLTQLSEDMSALKDQRQVFKAKLGSLGNNNKDVITAMVSVTILYCIPFILFLLLLLFLHIFLI